MKQSTTFAQVATNQFDYLSSALFANTPPYKKHSSSRKFLASYIYIRLLLVMFLTLTVSAEVWGAVDSGTLYSTANSMPTGWSKKGNYNNNSYLKLTYSENYIQTDNFCVKSFTSIKIKARRFGGPIDAQAKITVEWIVDGSATILGTITPSNTTLTDYTISSPVSITADKEGYVKISCKEASSDKGAGVSAVTITYTAGNCSGGGNTGGDSGDDSGDAGSGGCEWQLVTDVDDLEVGDRIVIAAKDYNYALSTTQNNNNRGQAAITKSGSTISEPSNSVQILTLKEGSTTNTFAFYTGSQHLYAASSSNNYLKSQDVINDNASWGITINKDNSANICANGTNTHNVLRYNQTSSLFSCYEAGKVQAVVIYKKVCAEETDCNKFAFSADLNTTYECNINDNLTLTVDAQYDSKASNNITYQWYSNTTNSTTGGTVITGSTSASYQPSTDALSEKYYYCVASYKGECEITSKVAWVKTHFCDNYTFHTGGDGVKETNTPTCFTQVSSTTEWQITNYTIPSDTKFFVGKQGWWYDAQLGNNNSRSVAKTWSESMYLAPSMDASNANGSPKVGQATGAVGTLRIFDDSNWDNLYVGFIPNGYKLKFGTTEYAFTHKENSEYLSDIVEYNATSANYNASAGITNVSGDYVATDHTQEMRHIFVKDNIGWRNDGAKLAIYYWNGSTNGWCGFLKTVPGDATLFEGWIPASYTSLKFVRFSNTKGAVGDWNDKWNETGDLTISSGNNLFTITDWGTGSWSAYSRKGKFRIYNDSKDKNWYLHFYPHNVLIYDANSGSGTMASQSVPADATSKSVTVSANGFTRSGYRFTGWNTKANGSGTPYAAGASLNLTSDITLYAQWAQEFTVTYNANGGTTDCEDDNTYIQDETVIVCSTNPSQTGYTFKGWSDGTNTYNASGTFLMPANNVTLIAQWQINSYTVTWDPNGGNWGGSTENKEETYNYGAAITQPDEPTREGYRFDGWHNGTAIVDPATTMPANDLTYTAQWTQLHTITWIVGGSELTTGSQTTSVENGKKITAIPDSPDDNTLADCGATKFMGWSEQNLGSAEGQSAPADLFTTLNEAQSNYGNIYEDKTFYAVFASVSGSGAPTAYTAGDIGNFVLAAKNGSKWYALPANPTVSSGKIQGVEITVTTTSGIEHVTTANASGYIWTIANATNGQTISDGSKYIYHSNGGASGTNLTYGNSTSYTWKIEKESAGLTFKAMSGTTTNSRGMLVSGTQYGGYALSNEGASGYYRISILPISDGVSYSNYVTNCCELLPVTNLQVSGVTENSATLTWTKPSSTTGITELQIRNTNDEVVVYDINPTTTTATINGLYECTKYNYYVVSVGAECEVSSETVTAQPFGDAKTVHYDYNGGSGSPESFTTSCDDDKREIILPAATRPGYTFEGWYDSEENKVGDAGATYDPATSPITLYAHWTEITYQLNHSGSNYTITENKTTIKSSETPFTLHYTCTGDYGFPSTITISGGGKSWTAGTDYVWTVAADKQSATLTINQTTISANVTITINMATRYTVSFEHHDKGAFDGESSIEVLSSENTITLPTIEDVSCGFYDTFEGWIVSNSEYVESTTKPATIYAGGVSYKVTGDCTFRALYSKCEGDATQVYRKVTTTGDVTDGTYILVANTATPLVYSGHTDEKDYGDCISGLTADGSDFSNSLPDGAVPVMVSVGVSGFSIHNGTKFIVAGTSTGVSDNASYWQLTDGSQVNSKTCPLGVLQPVNNTTYVLQKNNTYDRFKTYENSQSAYVFLYKLIDKCTKYYSTNPSCEKPVGVHIVYNANAVDASMSCSTQDRTYKVENEVNKYPQLASQLQFCTNATREGYTLVGWNTQSNGQGTTYNINQNYYNLPVSGELDGEKWITLNLYAMWKPCIKFNLGNATGGTGVPDAVVENGECVLPEPTAEQLGTIPCGYEFYAWSETSITPTQTKPALFMPGDTYNGSALTLYAVYRWCEGNTGSDTYYFTFNVNSKTYCITQKHNSYARFVVEEATKGLVFGLENGYLYYLDENGTKNYVYYEGSSTYVTTTTTYPNADTQKTTFVEGDNGTTIVTPAILGRYLQMPSSYTDRAYYTTDGINPTLVEVQTTTCTYTTNPTCYTNTNLHFVTNGGTLNYPTDYDETDYQELAPGSTVFLPTATFAGEWTFEGWKRGSQLESQTIKPNDPSFYPVTLNTTQFEVDDVGDIYFYAVYSKTNDDKQFDPVNGGTYKLFAIGADGTKTYMPVWTGTRGTPSGVTTCAETGDYTITPGTGTHAGQYQITCGEYTLGVVSGNTDLNKVEGTWWNIEPSTSGKGTWRITVVGSTDDRALSCSFSVAKSFGNYAISNLNSSTQTIYRDMEIGECIYTEYTSTPENTPYITITGAPIKITSANGERVYASTTVHIEAHNFTGERIIHLSATNGFGVDPVQVRTNGQGAYSGNVKVYYEPTTDGDGQTITTSVLTASQTGGTNAEKISQTFAAIQGRNMPANFVIAAKWDGHWYALPANCTSSLSSTEGLLIEVDDVDNPTIATAAPASAKYGLREVIPSRQTDCGQGVVFTERFAKDDKQFALYNGSNANIQVNAQYGNYAQTNPDKYEWIPSTSDFKDYTLTNASTGRKLGLTSGTFGAYTAASNQVRLLSATFYEPAPVQVLKWKKNSVIVMYTGAEATATTQVGDNDQSAEQTLANQQLTHGIYELTTSQALTDHAGDELNIYIGTNTRVELEIPLIISGEVTASANAHDVVILENSKLTAAATKYSYKDVYVYGGAKLAIPTGTTLGVNNIILRAGSVATDGAGQNAIYQYIYPQVELKGTLTSSVQNIRYEYVTDYDHWYHLALPFDGSLASIHYPTEYYGDQVKLDNTGSWQIKRYAGEIRATGNYDAWKDIETEDATSTTAGQGYIFWGAPKKITANDVYDRPTWGIQRITMSVSAPAAKKAENEDKTLTGLSSHKDVPNNSGAVNDQGWNLIGNPYMVNLTTMSEVGLKAGQLVEEIVDGKWTGKWINNGDNLRYLTIPSEHFDTYEAKTVSEAISANALVPGRAFFVQLEGEANGITFAAANRASLMPALLAENSDKPVDIETGIVLSNETLQDEVNFWIKDGKTNDYEYNADYPKTPNNNHFNIYGVHTNGDLSWVATGPEYAAESMPIGYQVPAAGTYTLSVSETYYSEDLQALYVTDHAMSPELTVDLMNAPYEFSVNQAETNNERFTISLILKSENQGPTTGWENIVVGKDQSIKFIHLDRLYILRNGIIYDATGQQIQTINK